MTISEVSKKYNLSTDTLRYYERVGLIKDVPRTETGLRNYSELACKRIEFIKCMRDAGVEIEILLEYFKLLEQGKKTVLARKELLEEQLEKLLEKKHSIDEAIKRLKHKVSIYQEIQDGKRKDSTEE